MKNYLDKLDKYKKAVNSLTEMVNFESSFDTPLEKLNEALRDSIIYKFEFTFELAWKTIKEYLEKEGYEEINSPRKVLKTSIRNKFNKRWRDMIKYAWNKKFYCR